MKEKILFVLFAVSLSVVYAEKAEALLKSTKFTVLVVDENGKPVEKANIGVGLEKNIGWGTDSSGQQGITGSDGRLTFSGESNGHITYGANKYGYYRSNYDFDFQRKNLFRWEPWNPELEIVLRKIENPVPMYARILNNLQIPVVGKDVGFDLIESDWVIPYGKGRIPDFMFNLEIIDNGGDDFEYNLRLKFPNRYDGIQTFKENNLQGSDYLLPRIAPLDGYNGEITTFLKGLKRGAKMSWNKDQHYIFRVRSEERSGKLIKSMYGKILGDINVHGRPRRKGVAVIDFTYYLNPDYTRNLEFDPKNNLFKNLPDLEQVKMP